MAVDSCGISDVRTAQPAPSSVLEDARLTFSTAHELCYAIDNILDETLGPVPEAARGKAVPTGSGAFNAFASQSEEIRDRMQQTIYRLQTFRSQLGANS